MPGRNASSGSISRFGNHSATSASLRCAVGSSSNSQKGEQKANRDTKLLETIVT